MEQRVGKLEVQVGTILQQLRTHEEWVRESREFHSKMNTFKDTLLAQQEAQRYEQNMHHRSNTMKLNIISVCIAIVTAVIMGVGIIVSVWVSHHAEVTPSQILHSQSDPQLAQNDQLIATEQ